jgi:hypothetical protein
MFVTLTKEYFLSIIWGFAINAAPQSCVTLDAVITTIGGDAVQVTANPVTGLAEVLTSGKADIFANTLVRDTIIPQAPVVVIPNTGLLRVGICVGKSPLRVLLAHELGHLYELLDSGQAKYFDRFQEDRAGQEEDADAAAFSLMPQLGADCAEFKDALLAVRKDGGLSGLLSAFIPKALSYYQPDHIRVEKCKAALTR